MALEFGDLGSGFRHKEIIKFINSEVLVNGGRPEFYVGWRSLPWEEVEDRLLQVVEDPQAPPDINRACAWSALALAVQHKNHICLLRKPVEEREVMSQALAAEVQQLREKNEEAEIRLYFKRSNLKKALNERDIMYRWVQQIVRANRGTLPSEQLVPMQQIQSTRAEALPVTADTDLMALGPRGGQYVQTPTMVPPPRLYMPVPLRPWSQMSQESSSLPWPEPCPATAPNQVAQSSPPVPPDAVMEAQIATARWQTPAGMTYQPYMWAQMGFQEMAPQRDPADASFTTLVRVTT